MFDFRVVRVGFMKDAVHYISFEETKHLSQIKLHVGQSLISLTSFTLFIQEK